MTAFTLVLLVIFLFGVSLILVLRRRSVAITSVAQLDALSQPLDLDAFRTLISVSDEEYLRSSLPGRDFRRVQRLRMRAAMDYVGRVAHNCSILLSLGENGRRSPNPQLAKAGAELASSALHLRLLCIRARGTIALRILFPQLRFPAGSICDIYAATRERVVAFGRIDLPALAGRIESSL